MLTITESQISEIKKIVKDNAHVNIDKYISSFLHRRIQGRMFSTEIKSPSEYISFIKKDPIEPLEFNASLSINVTEFYRDKLVWDNFQQKIIPEIVKNSNNVETIQVWSAGCATGNEPYSIAMMLSNALENSPKQFLVTANDINKTLVGIAKTGKYEWEILKDIPFLDLEKYLEKIDEGLYKFNDDLKKFINFQVGDIASLPIKNMDVIVCRNLLIYYGDDAKDLLFKKFYITLKDDGFLILGMFESIPKSMKGFFKIVSPNYKIFQKIPPPNNYP